MEGPLHSLDAIKAAGRLSDPDRLSKISGTDDSGNPADFCIVDSATKEHILTWLSEAHRQSPFQPTFVRYSKAAKSLSPVSPFPTLGVDTTLPHHRLASLSDPSLSPAQDEYPVWYFFYGTLADPAVLERLLGEEVEYRAAKITGGVLTTWGGKYNALMDSPAGDGARPVVEGSAFLVRRADQEDALRCYETDKYEVVRCVIEMADGTAVRGLTFRFVTG
ncbi:hypothetical protein VTK56DRAFT_884 [Thermocarpiscus australiensis]